MNRSRHQQGHLFKTVTRQSCPGIHTNQSNPENQYPLLNSHYSIRGPGNSQYRKGPETVIKYSGADADPEPERKQKFDSQRQTGFRQGQVQNRPESKTSRYLVMTGHRAGKVLL